MVTEIAIAVKIPTIVLITLLYLGQTPSHFRIFQAV